MTSSVAWVAFYFVLINMVQQLNLQFLSAALDGAREATDLTVELAVQAANMRLALALGLTIAIELALPLLIPYALIRGSAACWRVNCGRVDSRARAAIQGAKASTPPQRIRPSPTAGLIPHRHPQPARIHLAQVKLGATQPPAADPQRARALARDQDLPRRRALDHQPIAPQKLNIVQLGSSARIIVPRFERPQQRLRRQRFRLDLNPAAHEIAIIPCRMHIVDGDRAYTMSPMQQQINKVPAVAAVAR